MTRYLINCDITNYNNITTILINKNITIICKMNNHDGTYDYIIQCDELVAEELKKDIMINKLKSNLR